MIPEPTTFLLLVVLGGWVGLDSTSVGQFMISRPVVAATIAGWVVGDPATGALLGLVLEALNLTVLPVGAARYPESGPAALAAGAVLAGGPVFPPGVLVAVLFALSWAWVSGVSIRKLREFNMRLMARSTTGLDLPRRLQRGHMTAIALDFVRGALLVAVAVPLLALLLDLTYSRWTLDHGVAALVVWGVTAAGITATVRLFGERRYLLFAAGVLGGFLALVLW
jgi:mannose/fructose/N-acetylgalactosamine-specific phosphotransferase system component IIC